MRHLKVLFDLMTIFFKSSLNVEGQLELNKKERKELLEYIASSNLIGYAAFPATALPTHSIVEKISTLQLRSLNANDRRISSHNDRVFREELFIGMTISRGSPW